VTRFIGVLSIAVLFTAAAFAGIAAAETGGTPVNICGRMTEYRAPTQTQPGSITVAGEQFAISSDARQNVSPNATVGSDVCMTGTWFPSQTVGRNLTELTVVPRSATCTGSVGPGIAPPSSVPSGLPGFHAHWYGQSGYPTLCPGEKSTATVAYYNSGSLGWVSNKMGEMAFLGTWGPSPGQDKMSPLGGDGTNGSPATGWPRYNRVAAQPAAYVGPGQVSWFQFQIQAPQAAGIYALYIRPLIEGAQWMEDFGVYWHITVKTSDEPPAISVTPTDSATVAVNTTRSYTATITNLSGCVDIAFVDADTYPNDGTFRSAGNGIADLASGAIITSVNGVSFGPTGGAGRLSCTPIPSDGKITFTIRSGTANTHVRPLVFYDDPNNDYFNLDATNRPTDKPFAVGGATRYVP
jgi:hypothetical protein